LRKGFTLLELIVVVFLISILSISVVNYIFPMVERNKKEKTLEVFSKLADALDSHYEVVLSYRKGNPDWIGQADCTVGRSWIVPPGCWAYQDRLVVWKDSPDAATSRLLEIFAKAGCRLVSSKTGYEVECFDGWGTSIRFSYSGGDKTHAAPYNPEAGSPIEITFTSAGKDRQFETADDLTYTWSSAALDDKYRKLTYDRLQTIADALDAYFRQRLSIEITERIYPNGLSQEDDLKVDWYLQLCTDSPHATCNDDTCSNLRAVWPAVICDGSVTRSTCSVDTILSHLNLASEYKTDAFGNPVYVNLCFDPDGDGYPNGSPPNAPASDRGAFSASVSNGFITVMSTGE